MRNLRFVRFGRWSNPEITSVCWDPSRDELVCTVGPTCSNSLMTLLRVTDIAPTSPRVVAHWSSPCPNPVMLSDRVVDTHHLCGSDTTCIVLEGGDIVAVRDSQQTNDAHIEIVGTVDSGIAAARWSPDEELLAIVTKSNTVIFMGATFDPLVEVAMTSADLQASKQVSVGWGKKETQFQGRGAKQLRDPTIPEKIDQGLLSPHDDATTTISWRGDGAYVAINSLHEGSRRLIRVYSRQGKLDGASEPVDGLEPALSWRPAGNLMATIQRLPDRLDVIFFERNGLRHGHFTLRPPCGSSTTKSAIELHWNTNSTVLAVVLEGSIQFWTIGNYHWYLKQEIRIGLDFSSFAWHPEQSLRFASASSEGLCLGEQVFYTNRDSCRSPYDYGAVAVIDGQTVKLTSLRTASVPPPMSLFDIAADSCVTGVAFGFRNTSLAILHRQGVDLYDWPQRDGRPIQPRLKAQLSFSKAGIPERNTPLWICCNHASGRFYGAIHQDDEGYRFFSIDEGGAQIQTFSRNQNLFSSYSLQTEDSVEGYGQDFTGAVYKLSDDCAEPLPVRFPCQLPWFEVGKLHGELLVVGLSRKGSIFANGKLLAKNCTSFTLTPSHLVFTTSKHLLKFVHLVANAEELHVPGDDPEEDERCRSIERGARLVAAIPTTMSLVLQMPRGNTETIFPRAMVVAGIRKFIEEKDYYRAFTHCRTQRVDMNILYDHRPAQFLANIGRFLDQLKDVNHVDLFLSSLREEDVTKTMYKDTSNKLATGQAAETSAGHEVSNSTQACGSKVNVICRAILRGLEARNASNAQNIITAHVCQIPPALDDGLLLVAGLMKKDEKLADAAVEHICFLADVNRLYEHALGLYDLELALLVAQQSQRDPKEYLPFVQGLHAMPELRRKFEIDNYLGRWCKALAHLQSLDDFDEFCLYTQKHGLYQEALRLYRYEQARLRVLTGLYAAHLESVSAFREAGLAYESLGMMAKATSCYRAAGTVCWQECLYTAQRQSPALSSDAMTDLATSLAEALWEAKDYQAAATVHLDYLLSPESAVRCLCKGYHFAEAMRLVVQRGRPELLATALDSGLAEAVGSTTEFLAECKGQLLAQVPRIAELRRRAAEDPLAFYEGERPGGDEIPDDISVAASSRLSTSASLFTRYTGKAGSSGTLATGVSRATSKNRRREEKKRARGRKGTVYEEEYLVKSVGRLVERVGATQPEMERLVFALVRREMAERARAVEALMADVVAACERAVTDVFGPTLAPIQQQQQQQQQGNDGNDKDHRQDAPPVGGQAVLQAWMRDQGKRWEDAAPPPPRAAFRKLALLGAAAPGE